MVVILGVSAIVCGVGYFVFGVKVEYLVVFAVAMLLAQGIDIDHEASPTAKIRCMVSLEPEQCSVMGRGIFHDITLYWYMKALVAGLFIGWNIHLRMDGIL